MRPQFRTACLPLLLIAAIAIPAAAQEFQDLSAGFRYGANFTDPGVTRANGSRAHIAKSTFNLGWVSQSEHHTDFANLDWLLSNGADPKESSTRGAREFYFLYRHGFRISSWTGTKLAFGPVTDTNFVVGFDLNTKNTAYEPRKRLLVAGPEFQFAVPKGFAKAALLVIQENNHNGIVGRDENFHATWAVESAWALPLGETPLTFDGYLTLRGPKGRDEFGASTKTELLLHPRLMFDAGALANRPGKLLVGIGFEYWRNKFGTDIAGSQQKALLAEVTLHF